MQWSKKSKRGSRKRTSRKPISRKSTSRKSTSRKSRSTSRNPVTTRVSRKRASRKSVSRKSVSRKSVSRKSTSRKSTSRKSTSRKSRSTSVLRKSATRASRKRTSRKSTSRKPTSRKSRFVTRKTISMRKSDTNIQIFVKDLSGDLIQIEISNTQSVFNLKKMVSDINGMSLDKMKLFSENGDVLLDHLSIGESNIKNEDILFVLNDIPDAPFKGKRWIDTNGKKLKGTRKKFYDQFSNPAVLFASEEGKAFEGHIEDFMNSIPSTKAKTKLP